ncbi:hypothetical protein PR048_011802 [Dryococelus australis]|uniref:HAT C-terminal dimerisation domain-containing protein n=1 Tax=Dryococelus australis TaxID=614101 RepID=A0ABQ9HMM2_9NEOP|nr:hypothetical protein PR048_011802 [Dryococelus australis]
MIRDACNSSFTVKSSLYWTHELVVLLSQSLHATNSFVHLLELRIGGSVANIAKIKPLRPTRWIYRGNQINEIIELYLLLEYLKIQDKAAGLLRMFEADSTFIGVFMAKDSYEAHYRLEYFSIIDSALVSLKTRFDQGLKKVEAMEMLVPVPVNLKNLKELWMSSESCHQRSILKNIKVLLRILLMIPSSSCEVEQSFSTL